LVEMMPAIRSGGPLLVILVPGIAGRLVLPFKNKKGCPGGQPLQVQLVVGQALGACWEAMNCSIHSVVTLLGLSIGSPRALSQMSWARTPMALETPKNTV